MKLRREPASFAANRSDCSLRAARLTYRQSGTAGARRRCAAHLAIGTEPPLIYTRPRSGSPADRTKRLAILGPAKRASVRSRIIQADWPAASVHLSLGSNGIECGAKIDPADLNRRRRAAEHQDGSAAKYWPVSDAGDP